MYLYHCQQAYWMLMILNIPTVSHFITAGFSLSVGSQLKKRLLGGLSHLLFGEIRLSERVDAWNCLWHSIGKPPTLRSKLSTLKLNVNSVTLLSVKALLTVLISRVTNIPITRIMISIGKVLWSFVKFSQLVR